MQAEKKQRMCPEYHILLRHIEYEQSVEVVEKIEALLEKKASALYKRKLILDLEEGPTLVANMCRKAKHYLAKLETVDVIIQKTRNDLT